MTTLYYVYDPMCSWCWGYKPTWQKIEQILQQELTIQYVVGGLAPDCDQRMSIEMQQQIRAYWYKIEDYLGTSFNHDFWTKNTPRRSTYPACRAIIAARRQGKEKEMLQGIQYAYYRDAKNPSDTEVLFEVASDIGLVMQSFEQDYLSESLELEFNSELDFAKRMGANSFPSLILHTANQFIEIPINYQHARLTIEQVYCLLDREKPL